MCSLLSVFTGEYLSRRTKSLWNSSFRYDMILALSVCNRVASDADMMVLTRLIRGRTHPAGFHINIHGGPPRVPKKSNMIRSSSTLCTVRNFYCSPTIVYFHAFVCACWSLLAITFRCVSIKLYFVFVLFWEKVTSVRLCFSEACSVKNLRSRVRSSRKWTFLLRRPLSMYRRWEKVQIALHMSGIFIFCLLRFLVLVQTHNRLLTV